LVFGPLPKGASYTFTVTTISDTGDSDPAGPSAAVPIVCPTAPDHGLTDVPAALDAAVDWAVAEQVVTGYADDTFRPRRALTRGVAALQLHRLLGEPGFEGDIPSVPFTDVQISSPYAPAIIWLYAANVVDGFPNDTFRPGRPVSRAQFANMLYRMAGTPGVSGLDPHGLSDVPSFADDAVTWLVDAGVMTGFADDTFRPNLAVTRAAAVRLLFPFECDSPWIGIAALEPLP
jgi:hypothetical protein